MSDYRLTIRAKVKHTGSIDPMLRPWLDELGLTDPALLQRLGVEELELELSSPTLSSDSNPRTRRGPGAGVAIVAGLAVAAGFGTVAEYGFGAHGGWFIASVVAIGYATMFAVAWMFDRRRRRA